MYGAGHAITLIQWTFLNGRKHGGQGVTELGGGVVGGEERRFKEGQDGEA